MATFRVTDPNTGITLRLTGDSPPTEQELEQIFSQQESAIPTPQVAPQQLGVQDGLSGLPFFGT